MKFPSYTRAVVDWIVRAVFFAVLAIIYVQGSKQDAQLAHQDQAVTDAVKRRRNCEEKNVRITKTIYVNSVEVEVATLTISYEEAVRIAGQGKSPIVAYRFTDSGASGLLSPGDKIAANDGLVLTATSTEPKQ